MNLKKSYVISILVLITTYDGKLHNSWYVRLTPEQKIKQ